MMGWNVVDSRTGKRVVLTSWATMTAWLLLTGRYKVFLRPEFSFLLSLQLGILLALLIGTFFEKTLPCPGKRGRSSWLNLAVLFLPLCYWAGVQGTSLGSHAFQNRSVPGSVLSSLKLRDTRAQIETTGELTPLQVLQYFKDYQGKQITTLGMVYADETFPEQHVLVYRFVLFCCAADAWPAAALAAGNVRGRAAGRAAGCFASLVICLGGEGRGEDRPLFAAHARLRQRQASRPAPGGVHELHLRRHPRARPGSRQPPRRRP